MKAKIISGTNIKGSSFRHSLDPITVLVGDNTAGKTAVTDAIRVALLGYDFRLGKRASDTFKLASGSSMACCLEFDNGQSNSVVLESKRGSVKGTEQITVKCPAVMLDLNEYLAAPGRQRRKFLFDIAAKTMPNLDFDALKKSLREPVLTMDGDEARKLKAMEIVDDHFKAIEESDQARHDAGLPLDEWFTAQVEAFQQKTADLAAVVKQMRGSVGASVSMQAQQGIVTVQNVEPQLEQATKQRRLLGEDAATVRQAMETASRQATAYQTTKQELEALGTLNPDTFEASKQAIAELESKLAEMPAVADLPEQMQRLESLRNAISELKTEMAIKRPQAQSLDSARECPHCGAKAEHWSEENRTSRDQKRQTLEARLKEIDAALATKEPEVTKLAESINQSAVQARERNTVAESLEAARKILRTAETARDLHNRRIETLREVLAKMPQPEAGKVNVTLKLTYTLPEGHTTEEVLQRITSQIAEVDKKIGELQEQHKQAIAYRADIANRERAKVTLEESELANEMAKQTLAVITELQDRIITGGLKGVMAQASELMREVLGVDLEFRDGDIGYMRAGTWVSHETFSGIEQAMAFCGLSLAFAQDAPFRIIMVDELGRFSQPNKVKLLAAVQRLISKGWMDNFVGIDVTAMNYAGMTGVKVIEIVQ